MIIILVSTMAFLSLSNQVVKRQTTCDHEHTEVAEIKCYDREVLAAEKQLRALDDSISVQLGPADRVAFNRAVTAWTLFRDLECAAEASPYGHGSMAPLVDVVCRLDLSRQRLVSLRKAFPLKEG